MLKYLEIFDNLKNKLLAGEYKPDTLFPTEIELAKEYDTSRTTIQKAVQQLVQANLVVRYAGKGTFVCKNINSANNVKKIALLLPNTGDSMLLIIQGVQSYLTKHNYELTILFYGQDDKIEGHTFDNFLGLIIYPYHPKIKRTTQYNSLLHNKIPVVTIDMQLHNHIQLNNVCANNFNGGYSAAQFLINNGHKNILTLFTTLSFANTLKERFAGFTQALSDNNIKLNPNNSIFLDISCPYDNLILEFLVNNLNSSTTAIFCSNDQLAAKVYQSLAKLNINVPNDISVMGYDNLNIAGFLSPTLTTVDQPYFNIGYHSAKMVISNLSANDNAITRVQLPTQIIKRDSVVDISGR